MKILDKITDNTLIVTPLAVKEVILNKLQTLNQVKFLTKEELLLNVYFNYHDHTLYYLVKKYRLLPANAKIIMDTLYYIDNYHDNLKLDYLFDIKQDLINKQYILYKPLFKEYLKNTKVYIYGYPIDNDLKHLLAAINLYTEVEIVEEDDINNKIDIYRYNNILEEVVGCAEQITMLIKEGISPNNIYLSFYNNEYISTIKRIFKLFNIPVLLSTKQKLTNMPMTKYFLAKLQNIKIKDAKQLLEEMITLFPLDKSNNQDVYISIIKILNKYYSLDETLLALKDILIYELQQINLPAKDYTNVIKQKDIFENNFTADYHVFLLGINQNYIPFIYEDDDYLSDSEKNILAIATSKLKNQFSKDNFIKTITKIPNLTLSYMLKGYNVNHLPSSIIADNPLFNVKEYNYQYSNNNYNNFLLADKLDLFYKYNEINADLTKLNGNTENFHYKNYNNKYKNIPPTLLYHFLNNKLVLSYSSIDTFYKCQFAFYLKHILKVTKPVKNQNNIDIGKFFHEVLCGVYRHNFNDVDNIINATSSKYFNQNTKKEKFYLNKYKIILNKIITILKNQQTSFKSEFLEERITINKESVLDVTIMGVIDKVLTLTIDNYTYVIVIDYKTGSFNNNLNNVIYGLDMQLLIYLHLMKYSTKVKNYRFAGAYISKIMPSLINAKENKSYQELLNDELRLTGYTVANSLIVEKIDNNYQDNSYIKGLRVKSDGDFYATASVYDEQMIDSLLDIVNNNINNCLKKIENADFSINPKRIGLEKINDITGCRYCEYYDICYKTTDDIVNLKEYKNYEFLGGDEDAMD